MKNDHLLPMGEVFHGFVPEEEAACACDALVAGAVISKEDRALTLTLEYVRTDSALADELSRQLCAYYGLNRAEIILVRPENENAPAALEESADAGQDTGPAPGPGPEDNNVADGETEVREGAFEATERIRREELKKMLEDQKKSQGFRASLLYGSAFKTKPVPMSQLDMDTGWTAVQGEVFSVNNKEFKNRGAVVVNFEMTDYTGSVRVSKYMEVKDAETLIDALKVGACLKVRGRMTLNKYDNEPVLEPAAVMTAERETRSETCSEPRVELHLHTQMSAMDALTDTGEVIKLAASWGQKAIAITDHGVAQSFPDAMKAGKKHGVKIIYGVEGYMVEAPFVRFGASGPVDQEIAAFDVETTGLDPAEDRIIEYGAVIFRGSEIVDRFSSFADPGKKLPKEIVDLTGITDSMLEDAPSQSDALRAFLEFVGDRPLAAHNAQFDVDFLRRTCDREGISFDPGYLDTLTLAQSMIPGLAHYTLDGVASSLKLPDFRHHRAVDDAEVVAQISNALFLRLEKDGVEDIAEINDRVKPSKQTLRTLGRNSRHIILLAANQQGLYDLYHLISLSHLEYFHRFPLMPRHWIQRLRSGLIIGSACESGEVFRAVLSGAGDVEMKRLASMYDYLEIQPICNNAFLIDEGKAASVEQLMDMNRRIVSLGEQLGIPVAATGDVHFKEPHDEIYRRILLAGKGFKDADKPMPLYFRTTADMLEQFEYLGAERAHRVVIDTPNAIAERCEALRPVPTGLFPPKIENSRQELEETVWSRAKELYGDPLPDIVKARLDAELTDIIGCNYDVIYISASRLVRRSNEAGYLVGSRGSVGSSLVAFMLQITEVNALGPHYRCPGCRNSEFIDDPQYGCGADLPDKLCPVCGVKYDKDGFSIPFETFLGFGGGKVPDIDLNFSGEYQAQAHRSVADLFGADKCFRAGTIGKLKDKTAYGFVKKYLEERNLTISKSEENRLAAGCCGVKRTTGQHPGGIVVIPYDKEIYFFCPVQHPADDENSDIITTHFEYHSMEDNLLKLDMLGHDDPTMLKLMGDSTGIDVRTIPLDDEKTLSLFTSSEALGYVDDKVLGPTGATAIPEFGTGFVRGMLEETKPSSFEALLRISGFSHGTDVWLGNARDYLLNGTATLRELIGCRDDIMLTLIAKGMPDRESFNIMESVRKGRGLKDEWIEHMKAAGVDQWYIDSCLKCKYLFPKAHAAAYVIMAFRIAFFKVHYPIHFYAAYFSIRAKAMDAAVMCMGMDKVREKLKELSAKNDLSGVESDMAVTLEACYEFYLRGMTFATIDIYNSEADRFRILDDRTLLPPFDSVAGLGGSAAEDIVASRKGMKFVSVDDFSSVCTKVTKAHIEGLKQVGALDGLPQTAQISLF